MRSIGLVMEVRKSAVVLTVRTVKA